MNAKRIMLEILGWTALFAILIDWIPYFVQMLLYFVDIKGLKIVDYIMVATIVLSPGISILIAAIGKKRIQGLNAFVEITTPILAITVGILCLLEYGLFYQLIPNWIQDFTAFESTSEIVGLIGLYTPTTQLVLLVTQTVIFAAFVPFLIVFLTHGTGRIAMSIHTIFALGLIGVYMLTRIGGIAGTPYRIGLLFIGIGMLFLVIRTIPSENSPVPIFFGLEQIPHFSPGLFLIIVIYMIAAPSSTMNGFATNSIVWIPLTISATIVYLLNKKNIQATPKIGQILWIVGAILCILTILAQIIGIFIAIQPWLLAGNLIVVPFLIWSFSSILPKNYAYESHRWLNHPIRHAILILITILAALFPFLGAVFDPVSEIAVIGIIAIAGIMTKISFKKAQKSTK